MDVECPWICGWVAVGCDGDSPVAVAFPEVEPAAVAHAADHERCGLHGDVGVHAEFKGGRGEGRRERGVSLAMRLGQFLGEGEELVEGAPSLIGVLLAGTGGAAVMAGERRWRRVAAARTGESSLQVTQGWSAAFDHGLLERSRQLVLPLSLGAVALGLRSVRAALTIA